jgi:hypothetical protein
VVTERNVFLFGGELNNRHDVPLPVEEKERSSISNSLLLFTAYFLKTFPLGRNTI